MLFRGSGFGDAINLVVGILRLKIYGCGRCGFFSSEEMGREDDCSWNGTESKLHLALVLNRFIWSLSWVGILIPRLDPEHRQASSEHPLQACTGAGTFTDVWIGREHGQLDWRVVDLRASDSDV